ncbi:UNVERIFIED_CONTAM: mapkbp1 [Trichonephila clavipes]
MARTILVIVKGLPQELLKILYTDPNFVFLCDIDFLPDPTQLLSSASRDRLVHIFDAQKNYSFAQTLDDHTSSVTAAKFVRSENDLYFVSCGADKSVIIRKIMWKSEM